MKYTSTRDSSHLYSFEEALCSGYAPDGGLFVPEKLPDKIRSSTLQEWSKLNYVDLATSILSLFLSSDEIPLEGLRRIIQVSLSSFDDPQVVPVVKKTENMFVVELFHGATFCFKDLSLQFVIQMLNYFAIKRNRKITLVVATTGDTGPAAVQAVQDCQSPYLGILVHYPEGQISDFQRKQLTTCTHEKIKVVAFQGGGDDMDAPIKNIMTDRSTSQTKERFICGVNSYNIARPLMQMVHFVWAYLRVVESLGIEAGDPDFTLDVVLPTGAMGNMAGGYMAKQMGVPIGKMNAGVNINDITHQAFSKGIVQRSAQMHTTMSEAINIQLPYNLERLLFYLSNQNHEQVKDWYQQLETGAERTMKIHETSWFAKLQQEFGSARVTDAELCETLRQVRSKLDYYADPNTGVAFGAAQKLGFPIFPSENAKTQSPFAIFATASPCKFEKEIITALGKEEWDNYMAKHFPNRGNDVLAKAERPLVRYLVQDGKTLEENQVEWEKMARELIQEL